MTTQPVCNLTFEDPITKIKTNFYDPNRPKGFAIMIILSLFAILLAIALSFRYFWLGYALDALNILFFLSMVSFIIGAIIIDTESKKPTEDAILDCSN